MSLDESSIPGQRLLPCSLGFLSFNDLNLRQIHCSQGDETSPIYKLRGSPKHWERFEVSFRSKMQGAKALTKEDGNADIVSKKAVHVPMAMQKDAVTLEAVSRWEFIWEVWSHTGEQDDESQGDCCCPSCVWLEWALVGKSFETKSQLM